MKKLLITVACALFGFAAFAQYAPVTLPNPVGELYISLVPAQVTNFVSTAVIDCRKQNNVAVQVSMTDTNAASISNITFRYVYSVDGITYGTTNSNAELMFIVPLAQKALGGVTTWVTNLSTRSAGYIKFISVSNDAAALCTITNMSIKYAVKMNAP